MKRGEQCGGTRQIALGLCDSRYSRESIDVVRCNIENLIKLPLRFAETTKRDIGNCVLGEQLNVARVEPLSFVEVRLAPIPLASSSCDISEQLRNPATIRQQLACLLKVTHRSVVILQAIVVIIAFGQDGLAEVGL